MSGEVDYHTLDKKVIKLRDNSASHAENRRRIPLILLALAQNNFEYEIDDGKIKLYQPLDEEP